MPSRMNEKRILQIVEDVFLHVYSAIRKDPTLREDLKEELLKRPHPGIVQLVSLPLYANEDIIRQKMDSIKESFESQQCHCLIHADVYLEYIKKLYLIWQEKYGLFNKDIFDMVCEFVDNLKSVASSMCSLPQSDVDSITKIIDAKTFMENSGIRDELVDDLYDVIEKYEYLDWALDEFDETFIDSVREYISKFTTIFSISAEFKELSHYLDDLYETLVSLSLDELAFDKRDLLKKLLKGIYDDLKEWAKNVVFEQTALDVHYLDASLAANVKQINIMLGLDKESEDESFELF